MRYREWCGVALVALVAACGGGGDEAATSATDDGADTSEAPETTTAADEEALLAEAVAVFEDVLTARANADWDAVAEQGSGAVALSARYLQWLSGIQALPDTEKPIAADSVTIEPAFDGAESNGDVVTLTGSATVTRQLPDGEEITDEITEVVLRDDGTDLLVEDYALNGALLSAAYISDADSVATVGSIDVQLIGGWRDDEIGIVEYLVSYTNNGPSEVEVLVPPEPAFTAVDGGEHAVVGVADPVPPGGTAAATFAVIETPFPVDGGTLDFSMGVTEIDAVPIELDLPAFTGAMDMPEPPTEELPDDAAAARDDLLAIGEEALDPAHPEWRVADTWNSEYVIAGITGSGNEAEPGGVSGFAPIYSKVADRDVLPFAVADSSGGCAGGVIASEPVETFEVELPPNAACTGSDTLEAWETDQ